jgi:hypothetical protein
MTQLNPLVWLRRSYRKFLRLLKINKKIEVTSHLTESLADRVSPLTRQWFAPRLEALETKLSEGFRFQEVDQIHAEPRKGPHRPETELHRDIEAVNWMLKYPWVVESGQSLTEEMDYYFSDARPMYRQVAVEVYDLEDQYLGFVVFSVSQKEKKVALKLRDFRFRQPSYQRAALALALRYEREFGASTIELPAEIAALIPGKLSRALLQQKERIYQCMPKTEDSPLAQLWNEITLHLYDGDMAFS